MAEAQAKPPGDREGCSQRDAPPTMPKGGLPPIVSRPSDAGMISDGLPEAKGTAATLHATFQDTSGTSGRPSSTHRHHSPAATTNRHALPGRTGLDATDTAVAKRTSSPKTKRTKGQKSHGTGGGGGERGDVCGEAKRL